MLQNELVLRTIICITIFRCRVFVTGKKSNFGIALNLSSPPKKAILKWSWGWEGWTWNMFSLTWSTRSTAGQ